MPAKVPEGLKVAVVPRSFRTTVPATAVAEGPVKVNVVVLMVAAAISLLNVTVMSELRGTPVAEFCGVREVTEGGVRSLTGDEQPPMRPMNSTATTQALKRIFIDSLLEIESLAAM